MNRTDRPNILIILADDHGYGDVSMHQGPHIQTPNIDLPCPAEGAVDAA